MKDSKVAIVTGAGGGIGAEIALHLVAQNIRVVVAEVNPLLKKNHSKDPSRLLFIKTDVKSESSVKQMINQTIKHFGRIDYLVNNAGIIADEKASFFETSVKTWNDYIATNLTGAFICAKYAAKYLIENQGSIVNIASTRAFQSEGNNEPYAASKGGLVALTHELAMSLAPDVRVNCISPGWINAHNEKLKKIDHQQHPVGRVGRPDDIAHMVSYLISDQASFITGQNFIIDGGMSVKMIYA